MAYDLMMKAQLTGILERACQHLDLTNGQFSKIEECYRAVGDWLSHAESGLLTEMDIYPQGSVVLGTTVKPLKGDEFDVDLVCMTRCFPADKGPSALKVAVGDRLRERPVYREILEQKGRCWRLNYAGNYHLDITPSIPDTASVNDGELVPDRNSREWKPSNPKGYRKWFEEIASQQPTVTMLLEKRAEIEKLPNPTRFNGVLRRCVQLYKRHRDVWFDGVEGRAEDYAPISIILTTLAALSYQNHTRIGQFETEIDLLIAVLKDMPDHIHCDNGRFFVPNPTAPSENFAEKWNTDKRYYASFCEWQQAALSGLDNLAKIAKVGGMDKIDESLRGMVGSSVASKVMGEFVCDVDKSRKAGTLAVVPSIGLLPDSHAGGPGKLVPQNTFYGHHRRYFFAPMSKSNSILMLNQWRRLKRDWAEIGMTGNVGKNRLSCYFNVRPTPISREYRVHIDWQKGKPLKCLVTNPVLQALAEYKTIPHVYRYPGSSTQLCLHLPNEWHSGKWVSETIIPWVFLWLFYFEEWLSSGEWKGEGEHPREQPRKQRRRN